jgi:hypothetical protein
MSAPPITVSVTDLASASELMLRHRFRHVPVVTREADGEEYLCGIISMRDLFETLVIEKRERKAPAGGKVEGSPKRIGIATSDPHLFKLFHSVFTALYGAGTQPSKLAPNTELSDHWSEIESLDALVFDIDGWEPKAWSKALKTLNDATIGPMTIVAYDPERHAEKHASTIEKLAHSRKFAVFAKPLNVTGFSRELQELPLKKRG